MSALIPTNVACLDYEALAAQRPDSSGYEEKIRAWIKDNAAHRAFNAVKLADGVLELNMLDVIGEDWWTGGGITSGKVKAALDQNKDAKTIKVLMNSPGGDAFEGLAIQSLLKRTGARVEIEIIGLAASAATVIAMAGDTIAIHEGAMFMIHEAWSITMGTKRDMRQVADFLEKVDGSILAIYARRTGRAADEIIPLVEATTWMTAQEAVDAKFATSVIEAKTGETDPPKKTKAKAMASNNQPPAVVQLTVEATIPELTDEEREIAARAAAKAAADAVADHRSCERRAFMDTHPLARAGKDPAPPFGGMRGTNR